MINIIHLYNAINMHEIHVRVHMYKGGACMNFALTKWDFFLFCTSGIQVEWTAITVLNTPYSIQAINSATGVVILNSEGNDLLMSLKRPLWTVQKSNPVEVLNYRLARNSNVMAVEGNNCNLVRYGAVLRARSDLTTWYYVRLANIQHPHPTTTK